MAPGDLGSIQEVSPGHKSTLKFLIIKSEVVSRLGHDHLAGRECGVC